jgi:hypothetical protein
MENWIVLNLPAENAHRGARSLQEILVLCGSETQPNRLRDHVSDNYTLRYTGQQGPDEEYTSWLISPSDPSALLMFVHPEAPLPDDSNILRFPVSAVPHLDFSNAKLGGSIRIVRLYKCLLVGCVGSFLNTTTTLSSSRGFARNT